VKASVDTGQNGLKDEAYRVRPFSVSQHVNLVRD
jgi:hypothetical protein